MFYFTLTLHPVKRVETENCIPASHHDGKMLYIGLFDVAITVVLACIQERDLAVHIAEIN
jgi:hypothetical protein